MAARENKQEFAALILAGGRGARFWPRSRVRTPKQLLNIAGEGTMLEQTLARVRQLTRPENIWIITSAEQRSSVISQAADVPTAQIIGEPVGRNTAPAIGLGAELILRARGDVTMGVFPSDHLIRNRAKFLTILRAGIAETQRPGRLLVLGIPPERPETGYGYIEVIEDPRARGGLLRVRRFIEKPNPSTAAKLVQAGNYYWNAGMFLWRAAGILEALAEYLPGTSERLRRIADAPRSKFSSALQRWYSGCSNISIDYAVLEKSPNLYCLPAGNIGWNDLGNWDAVYRELAPEGGSIATAGELIEIGSANNLVHAPGKLIALLGVKDLAVIETSDALLVLPRSQAQTVKAVVDQLEKLGKNQYL